jgi:hypothetical protein
MATDEDSSYYQTVMVCPSCPKEPSIAWIIVVNIKGCSIGDAINTSVGNDENYILVPVRCGSCQAHDRQLLVTSQMAYPEWIAKRSKGVLLDGFNARCADLTTNLCSMLNKLFIVPYWIGDHDKDMISTYGYTLLWNARGDNTIWKISLPNFSLQESTQSELEAYYEGE